jgi:uracil-DNA glycosylase
MALHESVLEEFGLTPQWVRRGMAAQQLADQTGVGQGADALAGEGAPFEDARGAAVGRASEEWAQDPAQAGADARQPQVQPRSQTQPQPQAETQTQSRPRAEMQPQSAAQPQPQPQTPYQAPGQPAPRSQPEPQHHSAPQSQAESQPQSAQHRPAPALQTTPQSRPEPQHLSALQPESAQQSRAPEPPAFDAPPDDDFAWFDDLPTQPSSAARGDAPALPAIHTLDWDALGARVAACQLCRLCEKRTNTVFGVGDRNADWMLIGEAPGENEDRLGEPFVGQAGKLLDNMLRSLTLARDTNVYIANVIKCRPPGNRNPEPDEVARCEPYLQRQVSLVKPKLIVALGRFAAQTLLKTDASISSLRGRVHEYEGVPVIVTYHPAYLLRSLPDKAKAWADLCLARDTWRAAGGAPSNAPR